MLYFIRNCLSFLTFFIFVTSSLGYYEGLNTRAIQCRKVSETETDLTGTAYYGNVESDPCGLYCTLRNSADGIRYRYVANITDYTYCSVDHMKVCAAGECVNMSCVVNGEPSLYDRCGQCGGNERNCKDYDGLLKSDTSVRNGLETFQLPSTISHLLIRADLSEDELLYLIGNNHSTSVARPVLGDSSRVVVFDEIFGAPVAITYEKIAGGFRQEIFVGGPVQDMVQVVVRRKNSKYLPIRYKLTAVNDGWNWVHSPWRQYKGELLEVRDVVCLHRRSIIISDAFCPSPRPIDLRRMESAPKFLSSLGISSNRTLSLRVTNEFAQKVSDLMKGREEINVVVPGIARKFDALRGNYTWKAVLDSPCMDCGVSIRVWTIYCSLKSFGRVGDHLCDPMEKPAVLTYCTKPFCSSPSWFTTDWYKCHCWKKQQYRHLHCLSGTIALQNNMCSRDKKPEMTRVCNCASST